MASSFGGSRTGSYTLSLESAGMSVIEPPRTDNAIAYGETVEGALTEDVLSVEYTFSGTAGDVVTIAMNGDFDTLLTLQDSDGGEIARDDDGGEGTNSLIEGFELPATGSYTIVASSFGGSRTGSYTLSLQTGDVVVTLEGTPIVIGEIVTGTVTETRTTARFTFTGSAGDLISIAVASDDFDTTLTLEDARGNQIAYDDDSGNGTNSLVAGITLQDSGQYAIVVATFAGREISGSFVLATTYGSEITEPLPTPDLTTVEIVDIAYGDTVGARFSTAPDQIAAFRFDAEAGDVISVSVIGEGQYDTNLLLVGPDGTAVTHDDDSGPGSNPELNEFILDISGTYTLVVRPYAEGTNGSFSLTLTQNITTLGAAPQTLYLTDKANTEVLTFEGQAGQVVRLVIRETSLSLGSPYVSIVQNDELIADNNIGMNIRLAFDFIVPYDGEVTVTVRYYDQGGAVLEMSLETVQE